MNPAEPHPGVGDHLGVIGLNDYQGGRLVALCVALAVGVAPIGRAWAGSPNPKTELSPSDGRFIAAPPERDPGVEGPHPLKIADSESSDADDLEPEAIEVSPDTAPAPTLDPAPIDHQPPFETSSESGPRVVDSKRPRTGAGLIAFGSLGVAGSFAMAVTAMAGPGWFEVDRKRAVALGATAIPIGLISVAMVANGARDNKKYRSWSSRNQLKPPKSGTGMMVGGAALAVSFAVPTFLTAEKVMAQSRNDIGDWVPTALLGSFSLAGVVVLAGGMLRRSKFKTWERTGYVMPGTMAVKGGAGLSISGRF